MEKKDMIRRGQTWNSEELECDFCIPSLCRIVLGDPSNVLKNFSWIIIIVSHIHRLPEPALLKKGKKLVEPAVVSDDEDSDDEAFFLEQEFSGLYDETIWECIECYLNFPESDTPENNPMSYAYIREQQQQDQKLLAIYSRSIQTIIIMTI
eukprot:scaffold184429_cov34-Cyclotella_meneghiniana.AAC.1